MSFRVYHHLGRFLDIKEADKKLDEIAKEADKLNRKPFLKRLKAWVISKTE